VGVHKARIADTRKTLPGYRALDKYAVRTGGGANHRTALDAGILVKENHTAAAGSVTAAIRRARNVGSHLLKVEVEVETLADLDEALAAGAEVVLLDNMTTAQLHEAVRHVAGRALTEASGNMTLERIAEVAATGVDFISVGALTHSVMAADFSLRIEPQSRA
jgi:nicotinate-nucleotide pyrophosphorylase (carboxylating)